MCKAQMQGNGSQSPEPEGPPKSEIGYLRRFFVLATDIALS